MHYIQNQWVKGQGTEWASLNPANHEIVWKGASATPEQIDETLLHSRKALKSWSQKTFEERVQILIRFKLSLQDNLERLALVISKEVGKPLWESKTEVQAMIAKFDISVQAFMERCHTKNQDVRGTTSITRFKPHGVVAVFGPFNFPGHLANGHIIPALLAGNTVVFKPSELAPWVAEETLKIWNEVGLPSGVLQMLQGGKETGEYLAQHSELNGLYFTGSVSTGLILNQWFAKHPEKILALEMGGNNPLVVHEVQNTRFAVYNTLQSAFLSAGQRCTCARRLIVTDSAANQMFIDELIKATKRLRVGAYTDSPEPFMGPVISKRSVESILATQSSLQKSGGQILVESRHLQPQSNFISPGLIDVTGVSDRPDAECFGPLLQLIRVPNFQDALKEANSTAFGLAAGLITDKRSDYEIFWNEVKAGIINWNQQLTGASSSAPFGGIGLSGNHRPSAYFAADYSSYPVASMEVADMELPESFVPGVEV